MGAVASLNSLMAVLAPVIGAPLLALVSHLPPGDWRIGAAVLLLRRAAGRRPLSSPARTSAASAARRGRVHRAA